MKELSDAVKRIIPSISKRQLNSLMKLTDANSSGTVDRAEFIDFISQRDSVVSSKSKEYTKTGKEGGGMTARDGSPASHNEYSSNRSTGDSPR